jgi:uncharacterized lipoprotein
LTARISTIGEVIDPERRPAVGRHAGAGLALALILVVVGCSGGGGTRNCNKPQEYQASTSTAPLAVPDALDEPDRSGKLVIPEARSPGDEVEGDQPCLEQPPDYFDRKL